MRFEEEMNRLLRSEAESLYLEDRIVLECQDLRGFTYVVSSRQGLFVAGRKRYRKIMDGQFFGLTVRGSRLYAFQAHGPQGSRIPRGRLLRLDIEGEQIVGARVVAKGLDNGCHQMDFVGDRLVLVDTYRQKVKVFGEDFSQAQVLEPLGPAEMRDWAAGYCHVNSVYGHGDDVYLLKHNDTHYTGRRSELVRCDQDLNVLEEVELVGGMCHNIVFLEDGRCLVCDSMGGTVIDQEGDVVIDPGSSAFLRGLSVDEETIAIGESELADRRRRQLFSNGRIYFYDRDYRLQDVLDLPAAVLEIRRIDGKDLSLSNFRRSLETVSVEPQAAPGAS